MVKQRVATMPIRCSGQVHGERCVNLCDPTSPLVLHSWTGWAPLRRASGQGGPNHFRFIERTPDVILCPDCVALRERGRVGVDQESLL